MAGRPTKYTPELLELANDYIDNFEPSEDALIPMICGLAIHINIARSTVHQWVDDGDKPLFSDIVSRIMEKQEAMLFNGGLSGAFNASITKLALTKHGYTDKVESKGSLTLDVKKMTDEELQAVIDGSE